MTHFIELEKQDLIQIEGGWPIWAKSALKSITAAWLIDQVVDNWDSIKEGFAEGWNSIGN